MRGTDNWALCQCVDDQVIEVRADVHEGPQGWHASGAGFDRTARQEGLRRTANEAN